MTMVDVDPTTRYHKAQCVSESMKSRTCSILGVDLLWLSSRQFYLYMFQGYFTKNDVTTVPLQTWVTGSHVTTNADNVNDNKTDHSTTVCKLHGVWNSSTAFVVECHAWAQMCPLKHIISDFDFIVLCMTDQVANLMSICSVRSISWQFNDTLSWLTWVLQVPAGTTDMYTD